MLSDLGLLEEIRTLPSAPVGHIVFASPDHIEANIPLDRYPLNDLMTGRTLPMEGFVIRREVFDDFLFQKAKESSCDCPGIHRRRRAVGGRIRRRIRGTDKTVARAFTAPLVLGCDAIVQSSPKTGRITRERTPDGRPASVLAECCGLTDRIECTLSTRSGRVTFDLPTDDNRANIGIGLGHSDIKDQKINLKEMTKAIIARSKTALPMQAPEKAHRLEPTRLVKTPHDPREWFSALRGCRQSDRPFYGRGHWQCAVLGQHGNRNRSRRRSCRRL